MSRRKPDPDRMPHPGRISAERRALDREVTASPAAPVKLRHQTPGLNIC